MSHKTQEQSENEEISAVDQFVAVQLNVERRVVLQLREGCGLKDAKNNKIHAAFDIFNVAKNVSSFSPLPPFELKGELLEAFIEYILRGKALSTADRYALSRVTTIGNLFLIGSGLKTIDLSSLSNVTTVGDFFLCACTGVNKIDLCSLSNLTTIGNQFLSNCSGLNTVDLTPLSNVTTIGRSFLRGCSGLKTINLTLLSKVTTVGKEFLIDCSDIVQAQGKQFLSERGIRQAVSDDDDGSDDWF